MTLRSIRESSRWEAQVATLSISVRRLDEVLDGVMWAIARAAEQFREIPNTPYRLVVTDPFPGVPAMRIFFIIEDENQVCLDWIEEIVDDKDDPA